MFNIDGIPQRCRLFCVFSACQLHMSLKKTGFFDSVVHRRTNNIDKIKADSLEYLEYCKVLSIASQMAASFNIFDRQSSSQIGAFAKMKQGGSSEHQKPQQKSPSACGLYSNSTLIYTH